ncbi:serine hydrolase [Nocardia sp. NPDC088792]|uniref:serine hydrolase n=1 Tax=Nocardia sp. NPDC088792 TaxID=3364332 RepID=UPI00381576C0
MIDDQLDWLLRASERTTLPDSEIREHLSPELLEATGGPGGFRARLAAVGALTLREVGTARDDTVVRALVRGGGSDFRLTMGIDESGRIRETGLAAALAPPASWAELDERVRALGIRIGLAAAEIDQTGHCRLVHGIDADTARPIGSNFKLYVLGAIGRAVAAGTAAWNELLPIRDELKRPPSGSMQNLAAGTELPLTDYADKMIGISDNTATDHLMDRVGRDAVERELTLLGHSNPGSNIPFMTTGEFFAVKQDGPGGWTEPRRIDEVEWFATPMDLCRAHAGLGQLGQPEIEHALTRTDGGLDLDSAVFPVVRYKAGSEPGVCAFTYSARTVDGREFAVVLLMSDPESALDMMAVTLDGQAAVRGAFGLLAAGQP